MAAQVNKPVIVEKDGHIATITINNPPYNILTSTVVNALADAVVSVAEDPDVRCLILTGSGDKAFSTGANVREMANMSVDEARRYSAKGQAMTNLLERAPIPVIVAVKGFCLGGGCEISLACDFIVASSDAVFSQPEINIGVLPGWGGSRRLTRAIGVQRARHWILTGDKIPAEQAKADGLVDRVVPPSKVLQEALSMAKVLASKGALAVAAAKYAVNYASDTTRILGLDYERDLWGVLFSSDDQKEGMDAFLAKREPHFKDRAEFGKSVKGMPWDQQRDVYESAKREVKLPTNHPEGLPWLDLWQRTGEQLMDQMLQLSKSSTATYQEWVEKAWKMSSPRNGKPSGNRNNER